VFDLNRKLVLQRLVNWEAGTLFGSQGAGSGFVGLLMVEGDHFAESWLKSGTRSWERAWRFYDHR
ncbi:hypothetical protein QWA68_004081, partial [Fusarium oxysporum]